MTQDTATTTCPRFERALTVLAARHGLDLGTTVGELKLSLGPGFYDLVFGRVSPRRGEEPGTLYCGHYFEQNGDMVPDPIVWFNDTAAGWTPYVLEQPLPPRWPYSVAEMAEFAEQFAELLETRWAWPEVRVAWRSETEVS